MGLYSKLAATTSETAIKRVVTSGEGARIDLGGPGITIGFNTKTLLLVGLAAAVGYVIVSIGTWEE